jgi:hypothetical protein
MDPEAARVIRSRMRDRLITILGRHCHEDDANLDDHSAMQAVWARYLKSRLDLIIDVNE